MGNQLESALVIALRDTIKWESAVETSASGTLPPVTPDLPFDAKVYQDRDRWLAYRDLILGAAVVEVSIQVGDVWNYSTVKPNLQGPAPFSLPFVGTEAGTLSTQVRHVTNVSVPYDAARYADADLYGRDSIVYECLARACSATFIDPSIPLSDSTGTNIPSTSIWSLAEGTEVRADINEVLPLNRDLFKKPDQNLADRDNQLAGYTAQLVQVLKNPFEHATRLYVQVESYGTMQREPDVYALTSAGTVRIFQTEPAVPGSNRIIYDTNKKTLQWTRERVDEVHVPQLYAMVIPGIEFGQLIETLAEVPEKKDAQYWRGKAGQLNPEGVRLVDTDVYLTSTNNNSVTGGIMQYGSASFTVPDVMTFTMGGSLTGGNYRVSVLTKPNNVVEIAGAQNNSITGGIAGGATFDINVPSGSILEKTYVVVGGNGIVYNGVTYLPGDTFNGLTGITTYTTNPPVASTVRQYALSFAMALPAGAWRCLLEYTNLSGTTDGFAIKAEYIAAGEDPIIVIQDTAPIPWTANNGDVVFSPPSAFDVPTSVPFTFNVYWTGGEGQLHIRKIIFDNMDVTTGRYAMTGTFVGSNAQVDVNGSSAVPDVMRWHYTSFGTTHTGGIPFTINYTQDPTLPIQIQQVQVQIYEDYDTTPLSQRFQGWRQECLDRAERVIQQGYNAAIAAYGTNVPTFRDSGSVWTQESTENWMSFVEVYNPRVRQVPSIVDTGITAGRQYQVETVFVNYGGTVYTEGQKFYGAVSAGTVYTNGTVHQVGAFKKSQPGHLGKPALVPYGLYWDETTQRCMSWYDTSLSIPTIQACQAWMIEQGIYVAQDDFWMPETLGLTIPLPPNVTVSGYVLPGGSGVISGLGIFPPGSDVTVSVVGAISVTNGCADIVFLVDESGSMNTEHAWLTTLPTLLEAALLAQGIGTSTPNQYALLGFGSTQAGHGTPPGNYPHKHVVGGGDWGTAAQCATAAGGLVVAGGNEDGYFAMNYALTNYTFRGGSAVKVFILITDEHRYNLDPSSDRVTTLNAMQAAGVVFATVNDLQILSTTLTDSIGRKGNTVYQTNLMAPYYTIATYDSITYGQAPVNPDNVNVVYDYCTFAEQLGGSEWNLNILRNGGADATSFTAAFVAVVQNQINIALSYSFDHWTVNGVPYYTNPLTFTADVDTVVIAYMTATAPPAPTVCPAVITYPSITYSIPVITPIAAFTSDFDRINRRIFLHSEDQPNSITIVSTVTHTMLAQYLGSNAPYPQLPFGANSTVYDPVHDVVVMTGQAWGWARLDPSTGIYAFTEMAATLGDTSAWRHALACDTRRGNVLYAVSRGATQGYEVSRTTKATFASIYTSPNPVVPGVNLSGACYNEQADKYVILNQGGTPAIYYVNPTTFAISASATGVTASNNGGAKIYAINDTPWVAFLNNAQMLTIIDASTDTVVFTGAQAFNNFYGIAYNYCMGSLFCNDLIDIKMYAVPGFAYLGFFNPKNYYNLHFDPYANRVYAVTTDNSPALIVSF